MNTIFLVRHGTTDWVDQQILHGITDIPLNEKGLRQSRRVAEALKNVQVRALYTSPLTRCLQTANEIGAVHGLPPNPRAGLREMDFGWLEGKRLRDHTAQDFSPLISLIDHYFYEVVCLISGESRRAFQKRVFAEWDAILRENSVGNVVIVGHSAVFNIILIRYFGENFPPGKTYYPLQPGSITEIHLNTDGQPRLMRLDDVSHEN